MLRVRTHQAAATEARDGIVGCLVSENNKVNISVCHLYMLLNLEHFCD